MTLRNVLYSLCAFASVIKLTITRHWQSPLYQRYIKQTESNSTVQTVMGNELKIYVNNLPKKI